MNITLIGMPGSGKSYIGKKLADRLGRAPIELDSILEKEFGLPLHQALEQFGEERFLERQAEAAISNTKGSERFVLSPGGSIVYTERAMEHLKNVSTIVYLKTPLEIIQKRVAESPRGIVGSRGKPLEELYKERALLYERWASVVVDADRDAEEVVRDISSLLI